MQNSLVSRKSERPWLFSAAASAASRSESDTALNREMAYVAPPSGVRTIHVPHLTCQRDDLSPSGGKGGGGGRARRNEGGRASNRTTPATRTG